MRRQLTTLLATGVLAALVALAMSACGERRGQENKKSASGGSAATNGQIVFRRYFNAEQTKGALFTMNPDGSHLRQITHPPKDWPQDDGPAWSPDGERVAFHRETIDHSTGRIMVVDPDTGDTREITRCTGRYLGDLEPAFSPDGDSLAFNRLVGPPFLKGETRPYKISWPEWKNYGAIFIVGLDGSAPPHQVTNVDPKLRVGHLATEDTGPAFSPDGKTLVFDRIRYPEDRHAVFVQPIGSSQDAQQITPWNLNCQDHPEFSPDGKLVLFRCLPEGEEGPSNLYWVHHNGTGLHPLTQAPADKQYLGSSFSPGFSGGEGWITVRRTPSYGEEGNADVFRLLIKDEWSVAAFTALIGSVVLTLWWTTTQPGPLYLYPSIDNPFGIEGHTRDVVELGGRVGWVIGWASLIASGISLLSRWMEAGGEEHQQMKWFACALLVLVVAYPFSPQGLLLPGLTLLPVAVGIAILRYRLYDIDMVINRTLVYGSLSACVIGIYVLAVVGLGALLQARGNLAVSLLATGLVAVLFQPLRSRLQRSVNRLMYGECDDPYAVISRLGRRLEAALAPDAVLPTVVETIAQALKLPYAAILLKDGDGYRTAAAYGSPTGEPEALPLVYQREEIGCLLLSPRAPGEGFSDADRLLLEDLARQAEVAVHAVRLTSNLQRSRERLVATREEERRRLRRDLHDGLGAQLAGLNVQAGTLRRLIPRDPAAADELVVELRDELRGTIADIRRLVYDLRPPALDDLGLAEALRRLAERYGSEGEHLRVVVEAPEALPNLPAAVEVAVYRIAQEALTNVARHARARSCAVRLVVNEDVALEIVDDGVGIPTQRGAGVGLSSMRERAGELGGSCVVEPAPKGGTRVMVRLPLPKEW